MKTHRPMSFSEKTVSEKHIILGGPKPRTFLHEMNLPLLKK